MIKIAFASQKGGVAKTTSAYSFAMGLVRKGYKVLAIDSDPQENMAIAADVDLRTVDPEVFDYDFHVKQVAYLTRGEVDATKTDLKTLDLSKYDDDVAERLAEIAEDLPKLRETKEQEDTSVTKKYAGTYPALYDVLLGNAKATRAVIKLKTRYDQPLSLIIAGNALVDIDQFLTRRRGNPITYLRECLAELEDQYDFCIIDCAPAVSIMQLNVFAYVDYVMIPLELGNFAYKGIDQVYKAIFDVYKDNPSLYVLGWFFTKVRGGNNKITKAWKKEMRNHAKFFCAPVFDWETTLKAAVEEANTAQKSVFDYPRAKATADEYEFLVDEMIERLKKVDPETIKRINAERGVF